MWVFCRRARSSEWVRLLLGDDYGGGYFVLRFEIEELDALGPEAGGADGFGLDAE